MNVLQAVLLALFCYLSGEGIPWLVGDYLGFLVFEKPLVAGLVAGIILNDIQGGIIIGAALQTIYLGSMIVGGVTATDVVSVSYIALPLALASGGDVDLAIAIAVTLGLLGTVVFNAIAVINIFWIQLCDKAAAKSDYNGVLKYHVLGTQVTTFIMRFFPAFIILYYGVDYIPTVVNLAPEIILDMFSVMGGILPVAGIVIIASMLIKEMTDWVYVLIGFILLVFFNQSMISVAIIAIIFAVITYLNSNSKDKSNGSDEVTL